MSLKNNFGWYGKTGIEIATNNGNSQSVCIVWTSFLLCFIDLFPQWGIVFCFMFMLFPQILQKRQFSVYCINSLFDRCFGDRKLQQSVTWKMLNCKFKHVWIYINSHDHKVQLNVAVSELCTLCSIVRTANKNFFNKLYLFDRIDNFFGCQLHSSPRGSLISTKHNAFVSVSQKIPNYYITKLFCMR
jgi:hypothetical protein